MVKLICLILALHFMLFIQHAYTINTGCWSTDQQQPVLCTPAFQNAAFGRYVNATNTCGSIPEYRDFCWQTDVTQRSRDCDVCDPSIEGKAHDSSLLTDSHKPKYEDESRTWWQSDNLNAIPLHQPKFTVNLTVDLGTLFSVTYVRLVFQSPRPHSFAIYKRNTKEEKWIAWQYFSSNCLLEYGLHPKSPTETLEDDEASCRQDFSDVVPLTGGNVLFSTLHARPNNQDFMDSEVLQRWATARYIRISLNKMNTFGDHIFGATAVLKTYFYAIQDLAVGGRCQCYGHAAKCDYELNCKDKSKCRRICACEHNTDGYNCEKCLSNYNNRPWSRATDTDANACELCDCNGFSDTCVFDWHEFNTTRNGGICVDCRRNTAGKHCDSCKPKHYRRIDGNGCDPCFCHPVGSESLECFQSAELGQCSCKPGVTGKRCDQCMEGFWNLTSEGCKPCNCNDTGRSYNTCNKLTGQCPCKEYVTGRYCDRCKLGYFNLQKANNLGCTRCFCYGHAESCTSAPDLYNHTISSLFTQGSDNWYGVGIRGEENKSLLFNSRDGYVKLAGLRYGYFVSKPKFFDNVKGVWLYDQYIRFKLRISEQDGIINFPDDVVLTVRDGTSLQLSLSNDPKLRPSLYWKHYRIRLNERPEFGWRPQKTTHEFIRMLNEIVSLKIRGIYTATGVGYLDYVAFDSISTTAVGSSGVLASWVPLCDCPSEYQGTSCESCSENYRRSLINGDKFDICLPCNCNGYASGCNSSTGVCFNCRSSHTGDHCEKCASGYFGDPLTNKRDGCLQCPCPYIPSLGGRGACYNSSSGEVICEQCPEGRVGPKCQYCADGYFEKNDECLKCNCYGNIDSNAIGNCDKKTGICLKCIYDTTGDHCERCIDGYYGDAKAYPKGSQCKACDCHIYGAVDNNCNQDTGECICRPHVDGASEKCDECSPGWWNMTEKDGCVNECRCDRIGSRHDNEIFAPCNITTGQCDCYQNIEGQRCDKCLPDHYGFSKEGCKPCECDPVGSVDSQCSSDGQCPCQPGVVERTCSRCMDNTYNLTVNGCTPCEQCYEIVMNKVYEIEQLISDFQSGVANVTTTDNTEEDANFNKTLANLRNQVKNLYDLLKNNDMRDNEIRKELDDIERKLAKIEAKLREGSANVNTQKSNMLDLKKILNQIRESYGNLSATVNEARSRIDVTATKLYEKAKEAFENQGRRDDQLSIIAKKATLLAAQQQKQQLDISVNSTRALDASIEAENLFSSGVEFSADLLKKNISQLELNINVIMNDLLSMHFDVQQCRDKADLCKSELIWFTGNLTNLKIFEKNFTDLKNKALVLRQDVETALIMLGSLQRNNSDLTRASSTSLKRIGTMLLQVEDLQNSLDEYFNRAYDALQTAKDARSRAEDTLTGVNQTLFNLRHYDDVVAKGREAAEDAKANVDNIVKMLELAERNIQNASLNLATTKSLAIAAKKKALEAKKAAERASTKTGNAKKFADDVSSMVAQQDTIADSYETKIQTALDAYNSLSSIQSDVLDELEDLKKEADRQSSEIFILAKDIQDKISQLQSLLESISNGFSPVTEASLETHEKMAEQIENELKNFSQINELMLQTMELQRFSRFLEEQVNKARNEVSNFRDVIKLLKDPNRTSGTNTPPLRDNCMLLGCNPQVESGAICDNVDKRVADITQKFLDSGFNQNSNSVESLPDEILP